MANANVDVDRLASTITGEFEKTLRNAAALARTVNTLQVDGLGERAYETMMDVEPLMDDARLLVSTIGFLRGLQSGNAPFD